MKKLSDLWTGPEFQSPIEKRLLDIHQRDTFIHDPKIQGQEHVFKGTIGAESDHKGHLADQDLETAKANYDSHRDDEYWPDYPDMDEVEESADLYYESADEEPKSGGPDHDYTHHVFDYTGERGEEEHHDMKAAAAKRGVKLRTIPGQKHARYGGKHITLRGKKADVKHVMDNHIGPMDESFNEAFLAEGPSDKWMNLLVDAIEKNKDKPEFMRFINQYQAWMETYDRAHQKLVKSKGIEGNLARGILSAVGIKEALDKEEAEELDEASYKVPKNYASMMAKKRRKAGTSEFGTHPDKKKDKKKMNEDNDSYYAMLDAKKHAKRDGRDYDGNVSVEHEYDAYHMKKNGFTHFTSGRFGTRTYHKSDVAGATKIGPEHHRSVSESVELDEFVSSTPMRDKFGPVNPKLKDKKKMKKEASESIKLDGRKKEFKEKLRNLFYSKMEKTNAKDSIDIMDRIVDRFSKD